MAVEFSTEQIITGLVAIGLILKGIIEKQAIKKIRTDPKMPERGCLYGDAAHDELIRLVNDKCNTVEGNQREILTILRERKNGNGKF